MAKKRWIITTGTFLFVFLMASGYFAIAAEYGSQSDPLVSLSYITDVLSPETLSKFEESANQKAAEIETNINTRIDQYSTELSEKLSEFDKKYADSVLSDEFVQKVADALAEKNTNVAPTTNTTQSNTNTDTNTTISSSWTVVKVASGKKLMLPLGAEAIIRFGSGECYSTGDVGLINLTSGETIANGQQLLMNNLYLVSIQSGRGIKATSEMTILVNGSYTIE